MNTITTADPGELQQIRGPSAFGGGFRRFLDLLWLNAIYDLKLRYVGSVLGYLWTLIRPLLLFAILYVVFTEVFRFGDVVENYAVFLFVNLMLFEFFAEATTAAVRSVVDQENMVRKTQFPRIVIPLAVVLTSSITLVLDLAVAFVVMLVLGVDPLATWVLMPVIVAVLIYFTAGVSLILSSLYVHLRDLEHIWGVAVRALLYAIPVLYPISEVPEGPLRFVVIANPLTPLFEQTAVWITDPNLENAVEAAGSSIAVIIPLMLLAVIPVFGLWFFNRRAPRVAEAL